MARQAGILSKVTLVWWVGLDFATCTRARTFHTALVKLPVVFGSQGLQVSHVGTNVSTREFHMAPLAKLSFVVGSHRARGV